MVTRVVVEYDNAIGNPSGEIFPHDEKILGISDAYSAEMVYSETFMLPPYTREFGFDVETNADKLVAEIKAAGFRAQIRPDCTCDAGGSAGCPIHDEAVGEK